MFSHLNPEQQKAVKTVHGRVLILAGAGSGKTSVLTYRIAHLVQNHDIDPAAILGLTFTNKAAQEMKERVAKLIPKAQARKVTLSTFHSFCMQILRKEIHHLGYTESFSLYDEKDVRRLLMQLVRHSLEHDGELPSMQSTLKKIAEAKNLGQTEEQIAQEITTWHDEFSAKMLKELKVCMRAYNAVDFDSLLTLTVELFQRFPDVLSRYQKLFQHIMIDEYQDTNPIQYRLAELLSSHHGNLCVVGDDDQSIYGWRGAAVENILSFQAKHVIKLEQNYRSTPTILHAANHVIANNKERHSKRLWSEKQSDGKVYLFHAPTELEEAQAIAQRILWLKKNKHIAWKDVAILYRSNLLSKNFETTLSLTSWQDQGVWRRGIPYLVFGGTEFYERAEIKDALAYLKVIDNPLDQESLLRIINVPRRGISDKTLDLLTQYNRGQSIPLITVLQQASQGALPPTYEISDKARSGITSFLSTLTRCQENLQTMPMYLAFQTLMEEIDYKKAILDEVKSEKMREFKWENVQSCIQSLADYEKNSEKTPTLHDFLASCSLEPSSFAGKEREEKEDKVHLMTIHSSKGLEFPFCFVAGLEDHILPHEKSVGQKAIEEERRLMYVAMTRAKEQLILSMARARKKMGKDMTTTPSRFVHEIPKELLKITPWQVAEL